MTSVTDFKVRLNPLQVSGVGYLGVGYEIVGYKGIQMDMQVSAVECPGARLLKEGISIRVSKGIYMYKGWGMQVHV